MKINVFLFKYSDFTYLHDGFWEREKRGNGHKCMEKEWIGVIFSLKCK
jgi:hypothetical protein